jgi:hypothetical protein
VLTNDGRVFTYGFAKIVGNNTASSFNSTTTPVEITDFFVGYDKEIDPIIQISLGAALTQSGIVYAWDYYFNTNLVPTSVFDTNLLNVGDFIVSILTSGNGLLVLSNEGRVFGIGSNANFALGFVNSSSTFTTFTELGTSTFTNGDKLTFLGQGYLISEQGRVFSWGSHTNGKTGQGEDEVNTAVQLAEITETVNAHLDEDEIVILGRNKSQASASVLITNNGRAIAFGSRYAFGYPNDRHNRPFYLGITVNPEKVTYTVINSQGGPTVGPFYWPKEYRLYYNTMLPTPFNKAHLLPASNYTFVGYFLDADYTNPLPTFDIVFAEEDLTIYIRFMYTGPSSETSQPGSSMPPTSIPTSGNSTTPSEPSPIRLLPIIAGIAWATLGGGALYWFVILKKSLKDLQSFFILLFKKKKDDDDRSKKKK